MPRSARAGIARTEMHLLLALACGGPADDTGETAAPAPADDTASEPGTTFAGTSSVRYLVDGEVVCDVQASLAGTPYTGDCADCTWATAIDATVTADASTEDCPGFSDWSLVSDGVTHDLFLAAAADWHGAELDYGNALLSGWSRTEIYGGATYEYPGPYYTLLAWDEAPYGAWTLADDALSFSYANVGTSTVTERPYYEVCGELSTGEVPASVDGVEVSGDVVCGETFDLFDLDVTGDLSVVVDTVDASTAADLWLWLDGPDGCTELVADDEVDCSYPPPRFRCPATSVTVEPGPWRLAVASTGEACAGERAGYRLTVAGAEPTLAQDEVPVTVERTFDWELSVEIAGTLGQE